MEDLITYQPDLKSHESREFVQELYLSLLMNEFSRYPNEYSFLITLAFYIQLPL